VLRCRCFLVVLCLSLCLVPFHVHAVRGAAHGPEVWLDIPPELALVDIVVRELPLALSMFRWLSPEPVGARYLRTVMPRERCLLAEPHGLGFTTGSAEHILHRHRATDRLARRAAGSGTRPLMRATDHCS
jgi:hypothetical protein